MGVCPHVAAGYHHAQKNTEQEARKSDPEAAASPDAHDENSDACSSSKQSASSGSTTDEESLGGNVAETERPKAGQQHGPCFELGKCPHPAPVVYTVSSRQGAARLDHCTLQLNEAAAVVFERTCSGTRLSHVTFKGVCASWG